MHQITSKLHQQTAWFPVCSHWQAWVAFLCVFNAASMAAAEETTVTYHSVDGKEHSITFVLCPRGELPHVKAFKEADSEEIASFYIAKEELGIHDYNRIVEVSRKMSGKKPLPALQNALLDQIAVIAHSSNYKDEKRKAETERKREALKKQLAARFNTTSNTGGLPVFGLTYDEAQQICDALQADQTSSSGSELIITQVALPTKSQWQYACRAVSDRNQAASTLNIAAWLTSSGAKSLSASSDKDVSRLYSDMNELFAQLKQEGFQFKKTVGNVPPIDLSSPDQVVQLMQRFAEFEEESLKAKPNIETKTIQEIQNKKRLFLCFLREVMIRTVADSSRKDKVPLLFGVSSVHKIVEGQSDEKKKAGSPDATEEEQVNLLCDVGELSNSVPNRWGIAHMMDNVPEWVRETNKSKAPALIAGCGVFDGPSQWKRCLVWHVDDKLTQDVAPIRFVGVRLVLEKKVNELYRSQLAARMREVSKDPAKAEKMIAELNRALVDVKSFDEDRYESEMRPLVEYLVAYITPDSGADLRLHRAKVANQFAMSSKGKGDASVPSDEVDSLFGSLAFVEGNADSK